MKRFTEVAIPHGGLRTIAIFTPKPPSGKSPSHTVGLELVCGCVGFDGDDESPSHTVGLELPVQKDSVYEN